MASVEINTEIKYLYQCLTCKKIYLMNLDTAIKDIKCCGKNMTEIGELITSVY